MFESYQTELKPISCGNCGKVSSKLSRCTGCQSIKYCDANCQRDHWQQCHKKECKTMLSQKTDWEELAKKDLTHLKDATGMFILGLRLGVGDGIPINHALACELYKAATNVQTPISGGHPVAMLHLALHYERGIGVEQSHTEAFRYYKRIFDHPLPGEDVAHHALLALSKYHTMGLGGAEQSMGLATKYYALSRTNPESKEEMQQCEDQWNNQGEDVKDVLIKAAQTGLDDRWVQRWCDITSKGNAG
eukprot:m.264593 g.264593  ORF g.264593 m.264593 type:complete len:247 (-) comp57104_c0_seq1:18-758(-)